MERQLPWYGDEATQEQKARIAADESTLKARRAAAGYFPIMEVRRPAERTKEVNCASCDRLGDFDDEGRRGWCTYLKHQVSTWHPVLCNAFTPRTRERIKYDWKGVVYG